MGFCIETVRNDKSRQFYHSHLQIEPHEVLDVIEKQRDIVGVCTRIEHTNINGNVNYHPVIYPIVDVFNEQDVVLVVYSSGNPQKEEIIVDTRRIKTILRSNYYSDIVLMDLYTRQRYPAHLGYYDNSSCYFEVPDIKVYYLCQSD